MSPARCLQLARPIRRNDRRLPGTAPLNSSLCWLSSVAACLYLWPLRDFVTFNANEGITLAGAERILQGQVPYRDFFTFVTPGSPYLMALWFKLFGSSFVVARSVMLVYAGLFAVITYRLALRMGSRSAALFAAALLTLGCIPFDLMALHNWDSTLFALLAIYCAQSLLEEPSSTFSFCLGCSTALTCLTEQSKGAGLLLGLGMAAAGSQAVAPRPCRTLRVRTPWVRAPMVRLQDKTLAGRCGLCDSRGDHLRLFRLAACDQGDAGRLSLAAAALFGGQSLDLRGASGCGRIDRTAWRPLPGECGR